MKVLVGVAARDPQWVVCLQVLQDGEYISAQHVWNQVKIVPWRGAHASQKIF